MRFFAPFLIVLLVLTSVSADDVKEKYRDIQKQLKEQQQRLKEAESLERSFIAQIENLNRRIDEKSRELRKQQEQISRTRKQIDFVKDDITLFRKMVDKQRDYLKRKLASMQRYGSGLTNVFTAVISSKNFSQMLRNMRYLEKIAEYDYQQIKKYKENLKKLEEKKKNLETLYVQLGKEEETLKAQQEQLEVERSNKDSLLASVRKQKNGYQQMLDELTAASNRLKEMLVEQDKNEYTLTKFALLKGRLPWPLKGPIAIPYGSYRDPKFNTPVFRRGIYIKAEKGEVARAVYTGKVVYADWFKGYGKVIIINHGSGYHSVYANLNEIFFRSGDTVRKREAIGRVGESGTIDAPALYFEFRYKGKPLNPLQWLARIK